MLMHSPFLVALITILLNGYTQQQNSPEAVYRQTLPSMMTLTAKKANGSTVVGSAFMLTNSSIAATAWHLVEGASEVSVRFADGETFDVSGLIDKDERRDLALIRIKAFGRPSLQSNAVD